MKVGDVVILNGSFAGEKVCVIVSSSEFSPGWHTLLCDGELIQWPESQLEMISESIEKEIEEIALSFADL